MGSTVSSLFGPRSVATAPPPQHEGGPDARMQAERQRDLIQHEEDRLDLRNPGLSKTTIALGTVAASGLVVGAAATGGMVAVAFGVGAGVVFLAALGYAWWTMSTQKADGRRTHIETLRRSIGMAPSKRRLERVLLAMHLQREKFRGTPEYGAFDALYYEVSGRALNAAADGELQQHIDRLSDQKYAHGIASFFAWAKEQEAELLRLLENRDEIARRVCTALDANTLIDRSMAADLVDVLMTTLKTGETLARAERRYMGVPGAADQNDRAGQ